MSLVWHIVWNDLRRLRVPLLLWATLIAVKLGLGVWLLWGITNNLRLFERVVIAGNWLIGIEVVTGYVLVAALLQSDVLIGSNAFWMTRPISGRRLFAAKMTGVAVIFGVVPVCVTLPWWLGCGYDLHEITLAVGETLLWQLLVVMAALPLAALTDTFGRFLLWSLVLIVGLLLLNLILFVNSKGGFGLSFASDSAALRGILGSLILFGGGSVAAVHQFFRRRTAWSFALAGVTIVTGLAVMGTPAVGRLILPLVIRIHESQIAAEMMTTGQTSSAPVRLVYGQAQVADQLRDGSEQVIVDFKIEGAPAGSFVEDVETEQSWSWTDGLVLRREGDVRVFSSNSRAWWHPLGIVYPEVPASYLEYAREDRKKRGTAGPNSGPWPPFFFAEGNARISAKLPVSFAARTRRDPPVYLLRADLLLFRTELVGEKPARVGETLGKGSLGARIARIHDEYYVVKGQGGYISSVRPGIDPATGVRPENYREKRVIFLIQHRPALRARIGWFSGFGVDLPYRENDTAYFLVNRSRGIASFTGVGRSWWGARIGTVGIRWEQLAFDAPQDWQDQEKKWVEQPGWWDEPLTLAKVEAREEGWVKRELRVDRFEANLQSTRILP